MAYVQTIWKNREVEKPRTYVMTDNGDGTTTLTPSEGTIFEAGTPISAENMMKIEDQLVIADQHISNANNPHGVTASQVGAYTKSESDNKYATLANTYTKSESNNLYLPKETKQHALLRKDNTSTFTSSDWHIVPFDYITERTSNMMAVGSHGIEIRKKAYYQINVAVSFASLTGDTSLPYAVMDLDTGSYRVRLAGANYSSTSHLTLSGAICLQLNVFDRVYAYIKVNEPNFDVVGNVSELRTYMTIREMV